MTYFEAAVQVLRSARRPLTTKEITYLALKAGLIVTTGRTPHASMAKALYEREDGASGLVKLAEERNGRAKHGTVRWTLASD